MTDQQESAMDIFKSLPEKTRAEVIDGELFFMPGAPRLKHQRIVQSLGDALRAFVNTNTLGEIIAFQCDVYLDENKNVVQPDIMFISNKNLHKLEDNGMKGVPDMIIEIVAQQQACLPTCLPAGRDRQA